MTTNYAIDIAAGLTQVLADNDHVYLYGVGRISQHGASTEYFLGDALGSVRQLVDGTGEVTLTQSYQPYGEVLSTEGDGSSVYAFTGEAYDSTTELVYLRARYYAPTQGRFLSRDEWNGDYRTPMSYNRWLYTNNNPIYYTDPSGLTPINPPGPPNHRDLTYWLYSELNTNANGYYAQRINTLLNSPLPINKVRGVLGWIYLVKDEAKWDFKHDIRATTREAILLRDSNSYRWYEYSVPGNIHFGFVGRAVGFSGFAIHSGAGYAEVTDPVHEDEACCPQFCVDVVYFDPWVIYPACIPLGCYYLNPDWMYTLFDEPGDYWNVEFGIRLYDIYGSDVNYEELTSFLALNGGILTEAPYIPDWEWEHPDWPFPVGYFDGPDTDRNRPIVNMLLWRSPFGD